MPQCNPVIPAQPKEARYGIDKLYTSPRLTRATYKELYGEEAPPYDPAKQIKRWFFTDKAATYAPGDTVEVTVYDPTTRTICPWYMTASDYATPNLPGLTSYPKWENPVASPAVIVGPTELRLAGNTLVYPDQAKAVAAEINAALGTEFEAVEVAEKPGPWKVVYNSEPRRQMLIGPHDAALILADRYEKGVGSPGKWSLNSTGGPQFEPDVPLDGEQDLRPEIPMPCRALLPNERFATVTFGGMGGVIERTDIVPATSVTMSGGLTTEQDQMLRDILAGVRALRGL